MTTINNFVKGNFLIADQSEQKQLCVFESEYYNESTCLQLFNHSLDLNLAQKDRNVILIDFGLEWMRQFGNLVNTHPVTNGSISKIGENKFGIFFFDTFCADQNQAAFKFENDCLSKVLTSLKDLQKSLNNKPAILFIRGVETLEVYFQKEDISLFVADLQQSSDLVKQINLMMRKSLVSQKLGEAVTSLASCKIFFDYPFKQIKNEVETSFFMLKLTLRKFNGYSFIQRYKFNLTEMAKKNLDIVKFNPKEEDDIPPPSEADLQKMFQSSFSLSISDAQKRAKQQLEGAIMPHMQQKKLEKWDNCAEKNKNKMNDNTDLIELEGSDIDQEQEDDDDFDV